MLRRLTLTIGGAVVLVLAAAAPALAGSASVSAPKQAAAQPYGWILQLRGLKKHNEDMTYKAFRAFALKKGRQATWTDATDPANPVVYKGLPLYMLVGRIDDKDPNTFNNKLADKGYNVVMEAVDGYQVTWTSQEIKDRKDLIVADLANEAPLVLGSLKEKNGEWSWKPNWPLRFVTGDENVFGNRKPAAIERISIEPATPSAVGAAPF
jgi:hypothetical protein